MPGIFSLLVDLLLPAAVQRRLLTLVCHAGCGVCAFAVARGQLPPDPSPWQAALCAAVAAPVSYCVARALDRLFGALFFLCDPASQAATPLSGPPPGPDRATADRG